ncbi:hypothetical protein GCM10011297_12580 [Bacterioplanes sanyensis]|uniref:hypothetical protein n=1 Tax=Bacterioplanes sanyensis TaxID=1249553 RepID=UPI001677695F|nr:hypothetical protein [Bacterioplanes sanyensis]GGY41049.1 hypothetical protein GCM10011297_12580 [Bacterioplanes sanyensis]
MQPYAIAARAFTLTQLCWPHLLMLAEHRELDIHPATKLLNKTNSWLRGELKSEANLQRFFDDFADWREQLEQHDSLADDIADLTLSSLFCAAEACLGGASEEDWQLLQQWLQQLQQTSPLEGEPLHAYWNELMSEQDELLGEEPQKPLAKAYFHWLAQQPATPFGAALHEADD